MVRLGQATVALLRDPAARDKLCDLLASGDSGEVLGAIREAEAAIAASRKV
jgi:hypothetical protein